MKTSSAKPIATALENSDNMLAHFFSIVSISAPSSGASSRFFRNVRLRQFYFEWRWFWPHYLVALHQNPPLIVWIGQSEEGTILRNVFSSVVRRFHNGHSEAASLLVEVEINGRIHVAIDPREHLDLNGWHFLNFQGSEVGIVVVAV